MTSNTLKNVFFVKLYILNCRNFRWTDQIVNLYNLFIKSALDAVFRLKEHNIYTL